MAAPFNFGFLRAGSVSLIFTFNLSQIYHPAPTVYLPLESLKKITSGQSLPPTAVDDGQGLHLLAPTRLRSFRSRSSFATRWRRLFQPSVAAAAHRRASRVEARRRFHVHSCVARSLPWRR